MSTQSENSLMKKTKKELVDIILRKDDVEAKLRKELSDVNLDFSKAKEMITKKEAKLKIDDDLIQALRSENNSLTDKLKACKKDALSIDGTIKRLKLIRNTFIAISIILFVAIIVIAII